MTLPQSADEADVKIRTPRRDWMVLFGAGVIALASAAFGQWWLAHRGESWSPALPEMQG